MGARLTIGLMDTGAYSVDFRGLPDLLDRLPPGRHLMFYRGAELCQGPHVDGGDARRSRRRISGQQLTRRRTSVRSRPMFATSNRNHAKPLGADGASRGASRGIANAKLQVEGGEMKLGRLDSKGVRSVRC